MALWLGRTRANRWARNLRVCDDDNFFASGARKSGFDSRPTPRPHGQPRSPLQRGENSELTASFHAVFARAPSPHPGGTHVRMLQRASPAAAEARRGHGGRGARVMLAPWEAGAAAPVFRWSCCTSKQKGCYPVRDDPQAAAAWPIRVGARETSCTITYPWLACLVGENDADGYVER